MDKSPTKKQLLEIIKRQEEELTRYKKRFQDVVAAHKRLLKEKEALELSLKVMSRNPSLETATLDFDSSIDDNSSTSSKVEDLHSEDGSTTNESADHLRTQLATLMQSIATLSAEKSRMEASFQADRKALRVEKEEQENVMKDLKKKLEEQAQTHLTEIENYKTKLMLERRQREKEHQDHGIMIRELQKLLEEERSKKEAALKSYTDFKNELIAAQSVAEVKERELNNQVESLKKRLLKEQDSSAPLLSSLQQEIAAMRNQHTVAIQKEQDRASEAERQTKNLVAMHEERVANLEARLAELSQTVGNNDRLRQEDQDAICKLKDRLAQLELEHGDENDLQQENCMDVGTLISKLKYIKSLIDTSNETAESPVDVQVILFGDSEMNNLNRYANSDHSLCHDEYRALKEEFEEYKKLAKNTSVSYSPSKENPKEIEKLKNQVLSLMERIHILQEQLDDSKKYHDNKMEQCQKELKAEKERCREKLAGCERDQRARLGELEQAMTRQRERAQRLVKDKEEEIASLKASFHSLLASSPPLAPSSPLSASDKKVTDRMSPNGKDSTSESLFDVTESRPMLHYVQELSRLQIDVAKLRKQKHSLETDLRDFQLSSAEEKESLVSQINDLTKNVARLERCQTREGANLEYLKNVVLSYLLTSDENRKSHMLNAIAAVLQFSDHEKISVIQTMNQKTALLPLP